MRLITDWFKRTLSDPQIVLLILLLAVGLVVVVALGDILMPVLASLVIAYLLEGLVAMAHRNRVPRILSVAIVFISFLVFVTLVIFGLIPLLSRQVTDLVGQLPAMIAQGQTALLALPERYPDIVSLEQAQAVITAIREELANFGQAVLSFSLQSVTGVITILIYLILMPLLVFFFLKDKEVLISWVTQFLPSDRLLALSVWHDVDRQIANYVRGKFWEILIVWAAAFVTFTYFGLQYAMLLGVLVGLSVIVPYVGATVVTIPVLMVAWFQWGWGSEFIWLAVSYLVIQALDGNVLVPLLFSEVVNLHPVAIIVAILFFGGIWGLWGVFFAIPLATLVNAVLSAWPGRLREQTAD
jgi:putative permease